MFISARANDRPSRSLEDFSIINQSALSAERSDVVVNDSGSSDENVSDGNFSDDSGDDTNNTNVSGSQVNESGIIDYSGNQYQQGVAYYNEADPDDCF